jgi:hypothetical protein
MPRIFEFEEMEIEMMAELVAERAQKCPERGDVLAHGCPHPQPDAQCAGQDFRDLTPACNALAPPYFCSTRAGSTPGTPLRLPG